MEYYVEGQELCKQCKYRMYTSRSQTGIMCGYILKENHSRIYDDKGKRTVEKNYCNKYIEREEYK